MKVITVSGAHKGVGKTMLTEILLRNLPGFAAIKITMTDLHTSVSSDEEELMVPEKDTCRMKQSGAEKVVWVKSTEKSLPEAMEHALSLTGNSKEVLIEGNSILKYINPTIAFFVIDSTMRQMKPSRISALKKADFCVVNQKNGAMVGKETLLELKNINPEMKIIHFDLFSASIKENENSKQLLRYIKERL